MKIYIVMGDYGSYDSEYQAPVVAFPDRASADGFVARVTAAIIEGPWVKGTRLFPGSCYYASADICGLAQALDPRAAPKECSYSVEEIDLFDGLEEDGGDWNIVKHLETGRAFHEELDERMKR